jgi:hypothetical protein
MAKSRMAFFLFPAGKELSPVCRVQDTFLLNMELEMKHPYLFTKSISLLRIGNCVLELDVEAAPLNMLQYNNDGYTCVKFGTPQG